MPSNAPELCWEIVFSVRPNFKTTHRGKLFVMMWRKRPVFMLNSCLQKRGSLMSLQCSVTVPTIVWWEFLALRMVTSGNEIKRWRSLTKRFSSFYALNYYELHEQCYTDIFVSGRLAFTGKKTSSVFVTQLFPLGARKNNNAYLLFHLPVSAYSAAKVPLA